MRRGRRAFLLGCAATAALAPVAAGANGAVHALLGRTTAPVGALATHRYWKIAITGSDGSTTGIELSRIEGYSSLGGPNVLAGATVTASSNFSSNVIGNAVDENYVNVYTSASADLTPTITFDVGSGNAVSIVKLLLMSTVGSIGAANQSPSGFVVSYSDDNSTWFTAWTVTGSTGWSLAQVRTYVNPSYSLSYSGSLWGSHSYWRFLCNTSAYGSGNYAAIEATMAATPTGGTQTTGGTATASDYYSGSYLPAYAFDGNTSTFWASSGTNVNIGEWLGYTFASAVTVAKVGWTSRNDTYYTEGPTNALIQFSDDNTHWTTAWQWYPSTWTQFETQTSTDPLYV